MEKLKYLFDHNRLWAEEKLKADPEFFAKMAAAQKPKFLWIGCSDSRISVNEMLGTQPGDVFVHRNIANLCLHTDFNCLSVLQYGIEVLGINHVIVCGHYGCGGIAAAMEDTQYGIVDNWLRNIRDIIARQKAELDAVTDPAQKRHRLVELNVLQQVLNVCHTTVVQNAWARQHPLWIHGWVYDTAAGLLGDLNCCISSLSQIEEIYHTRNLLL